MTLPGRQAVRDDCTFLGDLVINSQWRIRFIWHLHAVAGQHRAPTVGPDNSIDIIDMHGGLIRAGTLVYGHDRHMIKSHAGGSRTDFSQAVLANTVKLPQAGLP